MNGALKRMFPFKNLNHYIEHPLSMLQQLEDYSEYISSFSLTNAKFHLTEFIHNLVRS